MQLRYLRPGRRLSEACKTRLLPRAALMVMMLLMTLLVTLCLDVLMQVVRLLMLWLMLWSCRAC